MSHFKVGPLSATNEARRLVDLEEHDLAEIEPSIMRLVVFAAYEAQAAASPTLNERHLFLAAMRADHRLADAYHIDIEQLGR